MNTNEEVAEGTVAATTTKIWREVLEKERVAPQAYSHAEIHAVENAMKERSPEVTARLLLRWATELEAGANLSPDERAILDAYRSGNVVWLMKLVLKNK